MPDPPHRKSIGATTGNYLRAEGIKGYAKSMAARTPEENAPFSL
jgi:hypothetical protein